MDIWMDWIGLERLNDCIIMSDDHAPSPPAAALSRSRGALLCILIFLSVAAWNSTSRFFPAGVDERRNPPLRLVVFKLPRSGSTWMTTSLNAGSGSPWARDPGGGAGRVFLSEEAMKTGTIDELFARWPVTLVRRHRRSLARSLVVGRSHPLARA